MVWIHKNSVNIKNEVETVPNKKYWNKKEEKHRENMEQLEKPIWKRQRELFYSYMKNKPLSDYNNNKLW